MRRTLIWLAPTLLTLMPVFADAQAPGPELRGVIFSVEDGQADKKFLPNVLVTVVELGASGTSNDQGQFRVRLPDGVLPGQDLTLQEDQKDYYILFPVLSRLRVPATPAQLVEVQMAPKGSKVVLGANFIEQFITYTADDSAKKPKDPKGAVPDLTSYVVELARQSGRPAEELLSQISRWVAEAKESDDPRRLGLAAFAEKKFRLAAENFGRAADAEKRRSLEGFRRSAGDRTLEGDAYTSALDFEKALRAYGSALDDLEVYRKGRAKLGLAAYAESALDVANLDLKVAGVKGEIGIHVAGPDSRRYLEEAIHGYRQLRSRILKVSNPRDWANVESNLGLALVRLGERQVGSEGLRRLTEAVAAYRQALAISTRAEFPQDWAATQSNMGAALVRLGERQVGAEGLRRLSEAVQAHRQALAVFAHADLPQQWAATHHNLGSALARLGERQGGAEGELRLSEAVQAYRQALAVSSRFHLRQQWAMTQSNLGTALKSLGEREGGSAGLRHLAEAVEAHRQALAVYTRDHIPRQWATTQRNLGLALQTQIRQGGFASGLEQVDRLSQAEGIRDDPVAQASLRTLALVCHLAVDHNDEASRDFASLVALVEHQPDDFRLVWNWDTLRRLIAESKISSLSARRESLKQLIDGVNGDNKAAILASLKKLKMLHGMLPP